MKQRPPRTPIILRLLLRTLPEPFRSEHREGIVDLLSEYGQAHGYLGRFWLGLRAALDVLWVALTLRWEMLGSGLWSQDVHFGLRSLRRDAGTALFAVLISGLGVGASVSVFSVVDALLVQPLPFEDPERLVLVSNGPVGRGQDLSGFSIQIIHLQELQEAGTQFEALGGFHLFDAEGAHLLMGPSGPERVSRLRVTGNFFEVLGVGAAQGRLFSQAEANLNRPDVILLTHGSWQRRFGANPDIVGSTVVLDGATATIVGVLPASFDFESVFAPGRTVDYVAPFALSPENNRTGNTLSLIGRLSPGATATSALDEARAIVARSPGQSNDRNTFEPFMRPLRDHVSGEYRTSVLVLVGAVALVMLLVCANLSNLLLARGASRSHELAVRTALGAPRLRLVRQMLVESVLLAAAGALLGVAIAVGVTRVLADMPVEIALLDSVRVDGTALAFALAAAIATGLGFGVVPALRGSDIALGAALDSGTRNASQGRRTRFLRSGLVVSQVALACVLLVGATLVTKSLVELMSVELGYEPHESVTLRVDPPTRFGTEEARSAYLEETLRRASSAPGVEAAALTDVLPMGFNRMWCVRSQDAATGERSDCLNAYVRVVSEGFGEALGLEVLQGRGLERADDSSAPLAVMVSERAARTLWPDGSAVGEVVLTGFRDSRQEWTVIGVVRGTRFLSPEQEPGPEVFFPIRQTSDHSAIHLLTRGRGSVGELSEAVGTALIGLDPGVPTRGFQSLEGIVDDTLAPRSLLVALLSGFAVFALLLAALGIYSVIAHSVGQRRRELGIRIALGASSLGLQGQVVRETAPFVALGLVGGLTLAMLLSRLLESLLFGVSSSDPSTYAMAGGALALVAVLASWVPARRATRIDPVDALAAEAASSG